MRIHGTIIVAVTLLGGGAARAQQTSDVDWEQARTQAQAAAIWDKIRVEGRGLRPGHLKGLDLAADAERLTAEALEQVASAEREEQTKGRRTLAYLGDYAFDALVAGLKSPDERVRAYCAGLLGERGERALAPLAAAFHNPDFRPRSPLVDAILDTQSPKALPYLFEAVDDADSQVRARAIERLKWEYDPRMIQPLSELIMRTQDGQTLIDAANALKIIDHHAAIPVIERALERTDLPTAAASTGTTPEAFLRGLLQRQRSSGVGATTRRTGMLPITQLARNAMTVHGESYGAEQIGQLVANVRVAQGPYGGRPDHLVLDALIHLRAFDSLPAIMRAFDDRSMPMHYVAQFPRDDVIDYFIERLQKPDQSGRSVGVVSALSSGGRWAVPLLMAVLNDPVYTGIGGTRRGENLGHSVLATWISRNGGRPTIVPRGGAEAAFDTAAEVAALNAWWASERDKFLGGESVDYPTLHRSRGRR